jgi:pimeloyl-ACP methyl ester carboxylesterase
MSGLIDTGTTKLYHEVHGSGPPLLLITGAIGDAGGWGRVLPLLAEEFTVVTYDRRAMSRSPRPAGWAATSIAEQADDAAALLRALALGPALVVGHSGGASIACGLVARHPGLVRHAVLYEPPLIAVAPGAETMVAGAKAAIDRAVGEGGPRQAMEQAMRADGGDEAIDLLIASTPPADLERMLGNGAVFFEIELPMFASFVPDRDGMRAGGVPLTVALGADNRDTWFGAASAWLAEGTGAELVELPGGHGGLVTHPEALVELVRGVARRAG